jgi:hypothetical protein
MIESQHTRQRITSYDVSFGLSNCKNKKGLLFMSIKNLQPSYTVCLHFLLDQKVHKKSRQNDAFPRSVGKQEIQQKLASLFLVFPFAFPHSRLRMARLFAWPTHKNHFGIL